jgi:hypothetical protein
VRADGSGVGAALFLDRQHLSHLLEIRGDRRDGGL